MTSIDELLINKTGTNYFRFVDDFEFGCSTAQEADNILDSLQEVLSEFELSLNSSKTKIMDLPCAINPLWFHDLGTFKLRDLGKGQEKDLFHFYDLSIEWFTKYTNDGVIKYAIKKTASLKLQKKNWPLYESLLLQWAIAEPGVLPTSIDFLKHYSDKGFQLDIDKVKKTFQHIISVHAPKGHTSELAWAIWGMILFKIPFDKDIIDIVAKFENPVIALLCLDAKNQRLIHSSYDFKLWAALIKEEELTGVNWLLAYEALKKRWLPSTDGTDYLSTAKGFSFFKKNDVEFYKVSRTFSYKPRFKYWFFEHSNLEYEFNQTEY